MSTKRSKNGLSVYASDMQQYGPITQNQQVAFDRWASGFNLVLSGCAGTGKTFVAMYLALQALLDKDSEQDKVVIIRSTVPVRDQGYLPGTKDAKEEPYTVVYKQICTEIFDDSSVYSKLTTNKKLEFDTTSFLRGITWRRSVIVVDEIQNMNAFELDTVMTRVGSDSRIIFSGDLNQTDLHNKYDRPGMSEFMHILDHMNMFSVIEFNWDDIVRSGIVRDYLMTKYMIESQQ